VLIISYSFPLKSKDSAVKNISELVEYLHLLAAKH